MRHLVYLNYVILALFTHYEIAAANALMPSCSTALSGTYTINPSLPSSATNYSDFTTLANDLNDCGVMGPVTVNVAAGIYNEQIYLHNIPGTSGSQNIIIQADPAATARPVISFNTSGSTSYVMRLDTVSHLIIKNLAIAATGSTGSAVSIAGGYNDYISFENDSIYCASNTFSCVYSYLSGPISHITFRNNIINGGQYGMRFYGSSSNSGNEIIIDSNQIINWQHYGLYATYLHNSSFNHNIVTSNTSGSVVALTAIFCNDSEIRFNLIDVSGVMVTGMKSANCYRTDIWGNEIYTSSVQDNTGLLIEDSFGSTINRVLVANNMIGISGGFPAVGMYCLDGNRNDIIHNTVRVVSGINSIALKIHITSGNGRFEYFNNNLVNQAGGYAVYASNLNGVDTMDFNNYFSSGSNLAYLNSALPSLSNWQSSTGFDINSVSTNPIFNGPLDLHVSDSVLYGAGLSWPSVTTDIDLQPRLGQNPDIGADEFELSGCWPPTNFMVDQVIGVNGSLIWQMDTGSTAQIEYGASGYLPGTGTRTNSIDSSFYIITGLAPFTSYDVYIREICSSNDTSTWYGPVVLTTNCDSAMHGAYTIDPSSTGPRNFMSFTGLANTLNTCGVSGPVTVNVAGGTYNEQFYVHNIPGAGASNPILIQGDPGSSRVLLEFNTSFQQPLSYVMQFDTISYLTIRGISIYNSGTHSAISLYHGFNDHLAFVEDSITANVNGSLGPICIDGVNQNRGPNTNILIRRNVFTGGSNAIEFSSFGTADSSYNLTIDSNIFEGWYISAITINEYDNLSITHNELSNTSAGQHLSHPLRVSYSEGGIISDNFIDFDGHASFNLEVRYSKGFDVLRNNIISHCQNDVIGIDYRFCEGDSINATVVSNNMISVSSISNFAYGFNFTSCNNVNLVHNSVNVLSGNSTYALYIGNGTNIDNQFLNNSLINLAGGYVLRIPNSGITDTLDYNNYFTTGNSLSVRGNFNTYNSLVQWRAYSGTDLNSISAPSNYFSNDDLHSKSKYLDGNGVPLSYVAYDIDGEARSVISPDIGADEYEVCYYPDSLTLDSLGLYEAIIGWNPGTMISYVSLVNLIVQDTTRFSGSMDSLFFSGLTPNTSYLVSIFDSCIGTGLASDTAFLNFTTLPCPVVNANFSFGKRFHSVDLNSSASLGIDSIYWDFGDGNSSNAQNPNHVYADTGTYQVWMYIYNSDCGGSDSLLQIIQICDTVMAGFTTQSSFLNVSFTSSSYQADSLFWDFGDGSPGSSLSSPIHNYVSQGVYNIQLLAFNPCGESDTITSVLEVCDSVFADFMYSSSILELTLTSLSINADSLYWQLGDGSTSSAANFVRSYDTAGIFHVRLTAYNACGDSSVVSYLIELCDTVLADFSFVVDSISFTHIHVTFDGTSSKNVNSFAWDFGDGTTSTISLTPSHAYLISSGTNLVARLKVFNKCNDSATYGESMLGIKLSELPIESWFTIYPNPADEYVWAQHPTGFVKKMMLFDLRGSLISEVTGNRMILHDIAPGQYFLQIHSDMGVESRKLIKQ